MTIAIEITGPVVRLDLNRPDEGIARQREADVHR